MLEINIDKCTGCGVCLQKCPQKCIEWQEGEFGFLYPIIDKSLCVDCGICEKVCPIDKEMRIPDRQQVFAAVHKNNEIVRKSTSGGGFTAIADYVLNLNGVVYGCHMNDEMQVEHIRVETKEGLNRLRGSKYIQSDMKNNFALAEKDLKEGRWVLYTGTPCQIAGIYQYLGKYYERLLTVDLVCHGVGSQAYFDKYLEAAKCRYGNINEIRFRSKEFAGWSCGGVVVVTDTLKHGKKLKAFYDYNNYYYYYFLNGDIYRQSCYECKYANTERQGDFTLGDFWGVESYGLNINIRNGCTLLIVNNDKARKILDNIQELTLAEVKMEQAVRNNSQLGHPSKQSELRKELANQYETLSANEIQKLFLRNNRKYIIKGFLKSKIPYRIKVVVRKYRK